MVSETVSLHACYSLGHELTLITQYFATSNAASNSYFNFEIIICKKIFGKTFKFKSPQQPTSNQCYSFLWAHWWSHIQPLQCCRCSVFTFTMYFQADFMALKKPKSKINAAAGNQTPGNQFSIFQINDWPRAIFVSAEKRKKSLKYFADKKKQKKTKVDFFFLFLFSRESWISYE